MKFVRSITQIMLFSALIGGMGNLTFAQEKQTSKKEKSSKEKSKKDDEKEAGDKDSQGLGGFSKLLPLGQKSLNVKIPSFKDGKPSSLIRADSMTRVDTENMAMDNMDIYLYGEVSEKDVKIDLITAIYHMPTQVLSSEQRSKVLRNDFELEGDTLIFDTRTQQGKLTGNVQMIIFDTDTFGGASGQKAKNKDANPSQAASKAESK